MDDNMDKVLATGKRKKTKKGDTYIEFYASKLQIKNFLKHAFAEGSPAKWTGNKGTEMLRFQCWQQRNEVDKYVLKVF